jgi:hypothetical protein
MYSAVASAVACTPDRCRRDVVRGGTGAIGDWTHPEPKALEPMITAGVMRYELDKGNVLGAEDRALRSASCSRRRPPAT